MTPGADGDPVKDGPGRRLAYAVIAGLFGAMLLWAALDAALRAPLCAWGRP